MVKNSSAIKYLLIMASFVLSFLSAGLASVFADGTFYNGIIISLGVSFACYGVVAMLYTRLYEKNGENREGLVWSDSYKVVLCAVISLCVCYFFQNGIFCLLYGLNGYVPDVYLPLVENVVFEEPHYNSYKIIVLVLSMGIAIPIMEEMFFRKFLIEGFREIPVGYRLAASNICFVFLHDHFDSMILIVPLSVLCSVLLYRTKKVIYPIVMHCVLNTVGVLDLPINKEIFSPEYIIVYKETELAFLFAGCNLVIAGLLVVAIMLIVEKGKKENEQAERSGCKTIIVYLTLLVLYVVGCKLM